MSNSYGHMVKTKQALLTLRVCVDSSECLAVIPAVKCADTHWLEKQQYGWLFPHHLQQNGFLHQSQPEGACGGSALPLWPRRDWLDLPKKSSHDLRKLEETGDEGRHDRATIDTPLPIPLTHTVMFELLLYNDTGAWGCHVEPHFWA